MNPISSGNEVFVEAALSSFEEDIVSLAASVFFENFDIAGFGDEKEEEEEEEAAAAG